MKPLDDATLHSQLSVAHRMVELVDGVLGTALSLPFPNAPRTVEDLGPVVLCGSSRFIDRMAVVAWELEKRGVPTLTMNLLPGWYGANASHQAEAEGVAEVLDRVHLRKIDLASWVLVCNFNGYIGESTSREIDYSRRESKLILYAEAGGAA